MLEKDKLQSRLCNLGDLMCLVIEGQLSEILNHTLVSFFSSISNLVTI
jgi:hypothetical protein